MVRNLSIILIVFLYLVPLYQNNPGSSIEGEMSSRTLLENDGTVREFNEGPYYSESFAVDEIQDIYSHVSSITPAGNNKMACTWYAGSREGAKDVSIYFAIYDEIKGLWTDPVILVNRSRASEELDRYVKKVGNALIFNDSRGNLWLFYATVTVGGWSGTSINYMISQDEGETWTKSRKMLLSPFFNLTNNVKNKGINLNDGSILLPVYHEFLKKYSQMVRIRPGHNGISYEIQKATREGKAIQPSLIFDESKNLIEAFFRNMGPEGNRYILTSNSDDLGESWSELTDTTLPNPNAGFDMIRLNNGAYLGVINNSFNDRGNLSMMISYNNGKTWKVLKVLEDIYKNEYSYPSISRSNSGLYHVSYTYNRRRIKHVVFNEAWVEEKGDSVH